MINRISQIYEDRQARRRRSVDNESVSKPPIPDFVEYVENDSNDGTVTVETSSGTEGTPDFDSVQRLGLFGILHYTMNSRFHKVMLIGLLNVILIVTFFLFMFFFVIRVKCHQEIVYMTTGPPTVTPTTRAPSTKAPVNLECPQGYTLIDTVCWKIQEELMTSDDARGKCNLEAAVLFELKSEKQNQLFLNFTKNQYDKIWMGIACNGTDISTCKQDDLLCYPFPYKAFAPGTPNGGCIFYDATVATNVAWTGGDCNLKMASVCQVTPNVIEGTCSNIYNNNCYYYYSNPMSFSGAQDYCKSQCGNLPSVESNEENQFIQSIPDIKENDWIYLGGLVIDKDTVVWADGKSSGVYSNLQEYDTKESCLRMNVKSGNWSSVTCNNEVPFVCKVAKGVKC